MLWFPIISPDFNINDKVLCLSALFLFYKNIEAGMCENLRIFQE